MELTKQYIKDELEYVHSLISSEFRIDYEDALKILERLIKELS